MIHVSRILFGRDRDPRSRKQGSIFICKRSALLCACAEQRKPRAQNGCLYLVEPAVDALFNMTIALGLSAVAQSHDSIGEGSIASDYRASVAERAEIFCRIETECARSAERADRLPAAGRQMSLATVFDDCETLSACKRCERPHVRGLAVQVYREQRSRSTRNGPLCSRWFECQPLCIDVSKDRTRACHDDRHRCVRR